MLSCDRMDIGTPGGIDGKEVQAGVEHCMAA